MKKNIFIFILLTIFMGIQASNINQITAQKIVHKWMPNKKIADVKITKDSETCLFYIFSFENQFLVF